MAGFKEGIKVFFGGDTSQLRSSLNEANSLVDGFTKGVKKAGVDLGRGFGFGLLIFQAKAFFDQVINDAQKTRDAFEEMGKPVPSAVDSVARLGDAIDGIKKGAISLGTTFLSFFTKAGEGWGMMINRIRGVSREQEKLGEQIARDADKQEKARDEALKNHAAKEKERANQAKRDAEAAARAREKQLEEEYDSLVKIGKAETELAALIKKTAYDKLTLGKQVVADEKEVASLSAQIAAYKKNQNLSANDQLKLIELQKERVLAINKLEEHRADLSKQATVNLADQMTAAQAIADSSITWAEGQRRWNEEIEKTIDGLHQMGGLIAGIRGGNQFNEATDESLAEVVRRNRNEASAIRGGRGGSGIGQNLEAARLEAEALNAERELDFRNRIRQDNQFGGKELARQNFQGDPLLFDRVFDQVVKGQDTSEKVQVSLDKIEKTLRAGVPLVFNGGNI